MTSNDFVEEVDNLLASPVQLLNLAQDTGLLRGFRILEQVMVHALWFRLQVTPVLQKHRTDRSKGVHFLPASRDAELDTYSRILTG